MSDGLEDLAQQEGWVRDVDEVSTRWTALWYTAYSGHMRIASGALLLLLCRDEAL
jgi:hypothetical protein